MYVHGVYRNDNKRTKEKLISGINCFFFIDFSSILVLRVGVFSIRPKQTKASQQFCIEFVIFYRIKREVIKLKIVQAPISLILLPTCYYVGTSIMIQGYRSK